MHASRSLTHCYTTAQGRASKAELSGQKLFALARPGLKPSAQLTWCRPLAMMAVMSPFRDTCCL